MIATLLFALALAVPRQVEPVVVPAGAHPYAVTSASMAPGLVGSDVVMADRPRGVCGTTRPVPGDVVIVDRGGEPWIRRVVAGAGQTVQMVGGVLLIDGHPVARERATDVAPPPSPFGEPGEVWRETLPGGRSHLTLDFGSGRTFDNTPHIKVPPGHWFLLGDSRDNALDDRADGPTPDARLCGIVLRIIRSDVPGRAGTRP